MKSWKTATLVCALSALPLAAADAPAAPAALVLEQSLFQPAAPLELADRPCWIYCPDGSRTLVLVPSIPACYDVATTTCGSCNWTIVSGRYIADCFDGEIIG